MVVIATKADIKNERECQSLVIKKWAEAEKGICNYSHVKYPLLTEFKGRTVNYGMRFSPFALGP